MNLILNSSLLCLLLWSCCQAVPAPWISNPQQNPSNSGWGSPGIVNQKPKYPSRPQTGCGTSFNKPAFRPPPLPNQDVVKPVFSAWPRPSSSHLINNQFQSPSSNQQSGSGSGGWSRSNEHLLKPVFSAWPHQSQQQQKPQQQLVDVPFTVEIVSNTQNGGWSK